LERGGKKERRREGRKPRIFGDLLLPPNHQPFPRLDIMDIPFTDPTSLSFLPPRHDLESDSEGEDHHQPDSSRKADVPLEIALPSTPLECLIILVGKSALRFGQGLSGISNDVKGKVSQGDTAVRSLAFPCSSACPASSEASDHVHLLTFVYMCV
jgi:hypothetical protein